MRPVLTMVVGLPGSGKSTYVEQQCTYYNQGGRKAVIHSSDAIREELSGDVNNQRINQKVFEVLHKRVKEDLEAGYIVYYDATNISWKRRKAFLQELTSIDCYKECVVIATPFEECVRRNDNRERKVPYEVLERMYDNFDIPWYNEGWDRILLEYTDTEYKNYYGTIDEFKRNYWNYDQHNKYHNLTLGQHCQKTFEYVLNTIDKLGVTYPPYYCRQELLTAASLHDCAKPDVQTFIDKKNNVTEYAHYYEHEHTGCYKSLFYGKPEGTDSLLVSVLIRWHMMMHFKEEWPDKTRDKYYKEFTSDTESNKINLWQSLELLYTADKEAH